MIKAQVQAESEQAAAKLLISQNLFPITIVNKETDNLRSRFKFLNRVRAKDKVIFTRELSTLINAGLPLTKALHTVQDQVESATLQGVLVKVIAAVEGGSTLSAAFSQHPAVFSEVYCSLVAAGEASGTLDETLLRLANQQEKDAAIVSKIRSALIYPIIVLLVIIAVVIFMLVTVLPQVGSLYHDLHKTLPFFTQMLLNLATFITKFWWLNLVMVTGAGFGIANYLKTDKGRVLSDGIKLHTPVFNIIFKKVYMARFSRTLGTLLESGIPMLQALQVVRNAVDNRVLEKDIDESINLVRGGKALSSTLEGKESFLPLVPQMIAIGEESGAMDTMLDKVATFYEDEVDTEVKNLSTTIEPALMVIMGVIVGLLIMAVLFPVYSLVNQGLT